MGRHVAITQESRAELLSTCRDISGVLDGLTVRAGTLGFATQHAALQARLALLVSRLEAGDSGLGVVSAMNTFVHLYDAHLDMLAV